MRCTASAPCMPASDWCCLGGSQPAPQLHKPAPQLRLQLTVKRPRTPAAVTMEEAAWKTFLYTPACTDRMHTANGTLTTLLPSAAAAPAVKAVAPSLRSVFSRRKRLVVE